MPGNVDRRVQKVIDLLRRQESLAKRLGVGFQKTTVSPKAPDFKGRLVKAIANILK